MNGTKNSVAVDKEILLVQSSASEITLELPDGRTERLHLKNTCPTEFTVSEPRIEADGTAVIDVEILKFQVSGVSQELWPGESVTMSGGRNIGHEALPITGTVRIPAGKQLSEGAYSEQLVYLQVDCPLGQLHTIEPARMAAVIDCVPPAHVFQSLTKGTAMYDGQGNNVLTISACTSTTTPT